jgi:hypothetical protein
VPEDRSKPVEEVRKSAGKPAEGQGFYGKAPVSPKDHGSRQGDAKADPPPNQNG